MNWDRDDADRRLGRDQREIDLRREEVADRLADMAPADSAGPTQLDVERDWFRAIGERR